VEGAVVGGHGTPGEAEGCPEQLAAWSSTVIHRKGQPMGDFRKVWRRACIAAGLCVTVKDAEGKETKKATAMFHDFRRSCVRNLENAGTPRKVAKSITGHITDSAYQRYHVVNQTISGLRWPKVEDGFTVNQHNGHRSLDSQNVSA